MIGRTLTLLVLTGALMAATLPAAAIFHPAYIVPDACRGERVAKECTICHIAVVAMNITNFAMFAIAIPALGLLVLIGGITLLISGGSTSMVERGRKTLTYAIAGAIILFLAWLAVDTLIKILTGGVDALIAGPGIGPWNRIDPTNCPL